MSFAEFADVRNYYPQVVALQHPRAPRAIVYAFLASSLSGGKESFIQALSTQKAIPYKGIPVVVHKAVA